MGAVTAAVIAGAATLGAAKMGSDASKNAARMQQRSGNAAIDEQQAAREQFQQNIQPYLDFGQTGVTGLQALMADPSSIQDDPSYQWRFGEGQRALEGSAAARGGLFGGGNTRDLMAYGQGMASQEYGNQWNRLFNIAGMGQNAAVGAGTAGQNTANSIGNIMLGQGQAAADARIGSANAWGNAASGLAGIFGNYMGQRSSSYQQPASYNYNAFSPNQQGWTSGQTQYAGFNPNTGSAYGQWGNWG